MRIGVFGLGRMGSPIASALGKHAEVVTYDPAHAPGDPLGLAASVDVLVTVLPGVAEVRQLGPVLAALAPGSLWIDLTSGDPRVYGELTRMTEIAVVGAPMAGGPSAAEQRVLRFHVGGSPAAVERARPLLELLGTVEVIGPDPGDGQTAKLLANLLWFGQVVAVTEALLLGQSLGLDVRALRTTLAAGAGGSVFIDEYLDSLLDGDYLESFGLDRVVEELDTLASLARQEGVPFELSELVARLHREALESFGAVDGELLAAKLLEQRAGRTLG